MQEVEAFLASSLFRYLLFPIGSAVVGVWVKWVSKNDKYSSFRKEDLAVGLDLTRVACLMFVMLTSDHAVALRSANSLLKAALAATAPDLTQVASLHAEIQRLAAALTMSIWYVCLLTGGLWGLSTFVRKWGWEGRDARTLSGGELGSRLRIGRGIALPLICGIASLVFVMEGAAR